MSHDDTCRNCGERIGRRYTGAPGGTWMHIAGGLRVSVPLSGAGGVCSCGHTGEAHEHYRAGSDCALCDCGKLAVR